VCATPGLLNSSQDARRRLRARHAGGFAQAHEESPAPPVPMARPRIPTRWLTEPSQGDKNWNVPPLLCASPILESLARAQVRVTEC